MSVPIVGTLIYKFQLSLYVKGLINTIFISLKDNPEKDALIKTVCNNSDYLVCESYHFVRSIQGRRSKIIAGFKPPDNFRVQTKNVLEEVAWALIWSDFITDGCKRYFGNFVPSSFPSFSKNLPNQYSLLNFYRIFFKRQNVEIIVWDLDGTLFFSPQIAKEMENIFTKILSNQNKISLKKARGLLSKEKPNTSWSSIVAKATGLSEKKILTLLEKKVDRSKHAAKDTKLIEMFNKLKNYRHIILTNSTFKNTLKTLKTLGFKSINSTSAFPFERIFALDNMIAPKPDKTAFAAVLKYTNLPPEKHLMVGDFENVDILPAKALKFRTCKVGYKSPFSDYNSETVYDIPVILKDN